MLKKKIIISFTLILALLAVLGGLILVNLSKKEEDEFNNARLVYYRMEESYE